MKKYNYIYLITNKINDKQYVGKHSTDDMDDGYFGSGKVLKYAVKRYGQENFEKTILEETIDTEEVLNDREIFWISELKTKENGYNLTEGGDGKLGYAPTKEQRRRHLEAMNRPEVKQKISERTKEVMNTPEMLEKCREGGIKVNDTQEKRDAYGLRMEQWNKDNPEWRKSHNEHLSEIWNTEEKKEYAKQRAIKQFQDPLQREAARERAKGNNSHAKEYLIKFPDGHDEVISNLSQFCRDNEVKVSTVMSYIGNIEDDINEVKQYKGMKIKRMFVINNENIKKGLDANHGAKKYMIIFPDGHEQIVFNLKNYCKENDFHYGSMLRVARGTRKLYKGLGVKKYK